MPKAKQIHPADQADRDRIINETVAFNVHIRRGPHSKFNTPAQALSRAVRIYDQMAREHKPKRPIIYAIDANDNSTPVPADMIEAARKGDLEITGAKIGPKSVPAPLVADSKLSQIDIAKLTAMITGGGHKRRRNKTEQIRAFGEAAAEAGLAKAGDFLIYTAFEHASNALRHAMAGLKDAPAADLDEATPPKDAPVKAKPIGKAKADDLPEDAVPMRGAWRERQLAAYRGELPEPPDFSASSYEPFRKRLGEIEALAKAGDLAGLRAYPIKPYSNARKRMATYRDLAVIAIESRVQ